MIPADAAARTAALDIRKSFIVEAPAGSGKTALLIQRFLKLLLDRHVVDPTEVLAITFTVKATEEIRARITQALFRAGNDAAPKSDFDAELLSLARSVLQKDRDFGWGLLEQPARLNIRTIDGLAANIAKSLPLLSGGLGVLEPQEDASELYRAAARRVLFALGKGDEALNQALRSVLLHRDVNLGSVQQALADMLAVREQWAPILPHPSEGQAGEDRIRSQMNRVLDFEVCRRLTALNRAIPASARYTLSSIIDELCQQPGSRGTHNQLATACSGLRDLPGNACMDLAAWKQILTLMLTNSDGWRKGFTPNFFPIEATKSQQARLKEFFASIQTPELVEAAIAVRRAPPYPYPDDQWQLVVPLFRLLRRALAELQIVFAESRKCDFTEISLAALQALQTPDGTRDLVASLGTRIRHLLMDEMQDTSQRQYDLLELITAGWDGQSQTVFLVGDPKQSIYIFREARVELFMRALRLQRIGDVPLQRLTLTANFRSEERLVQRFNDLFSAVFTPHRGDGIEYTPAVAMTPTNQGELHWRIARQPYTRTDASYEEKQTVLRDRRRFESEGIVTTIRQCLADPHPDGRARRIAILVRSRRHAPAIIDTLRANGITTKSIDIDPLSSRSEVLDLLALTRALTHSADRTAWLAVMHAPWCGLDAASLHTVAAGDEPQLRYRALLPIMLERLHRLSPGAQRRAQRTLGVLETALQQRESMPFSRWVECTWRSLGGDAYLDADQMQNALAYLGMLERLSATGREPSTSDLDRALSRLYSTNLGHADVEVLTIHKSKGLEWDVVFVPAMERRGAQDIAPLLDWAEVIGDDGESLGVLLAPIQRKGEEGTALHNAVRAIRKRRAAAELDRLLYVAATRARSSLHMFATLTEKAPAKGKAEEAEHEASLSAEPNSLLHAAWHTVGPLFESEVVVRLANSQPADHVAGNIIQMPSLAPAPDVLAIAATAEEPVVLTPEHLPDNFDPRARFIASQPVADQPQVVTEPLSFKRPTGSLAARALGDSAHLFLEALAEHLQRGAGAEALLSDLPSWMSRITHTVRSHGLGQRETTYVASQVLDVLRATLISPVGLWTIAPHPQAESERAFLVQSSSGRPYFERVDRTFLAGPTPGSPGNSTRWIIDFKTGMRSSGIEAYLADEKALYAPKLENYARSARDVLGRQHPIRLGLYYPLLDRMVDWAPAED